MTVVLDTQTRELDMVTMVALIVDGVIVDSAPLDLSDPSSANMADALGLSVELALKLAGE